MTDHKTKLSKLFNIPWYDNAFRVMAILGRADSIKFMRRLDVKITHLGVINVKDPYANILQLDVLPKEPRKVDRARWAGGEARYKQITRVIPVGERYSRMKLRAVDIGLAICTNGAIQVHNARYGMFSLSVTRDGEPYEDFSDTNFMEGHLTRHYRLGCGSRILYESELDGANLSEVDIDYYDTMVTRMQRTPLGVSDAERMNPLFKDHEIKFWEEAIYAQGKDRPHFN